MAHTVTHSRRVPPVNSFGHGMVKLDPSDPARYVESAVYDVATGERLVRFPVDAREMVASGAYSLDPPESEGPEAA
ncbi:MAG: hypothetical protein AMXMBFR36_27900 [Acidobacteriota bacterium]